MSEKPNMRQYWMDRDRGILTEADREFLKGKKELSDQAQRDAKYRIRNRVEDGVLDLAYLALFLDESDRSQVAERVFPDTKEGTDALNNSFRFLLQLFFDKDEIDPDEDISKLEEKLTQLLENELEERFDDRLPTAEVTIEYDKGIVDDQDLIEKYHNNKETYQELRYLSEKELIEFDEEYWNHQFRHAWEQDITMSFVSSTEGTVEHDPTEYENKSKYIKKGVEIINSTY